MSVRRSLAWSVSGQIMSTILLFLGSVVIARLLTPAEVGVFAVAFAAAGLINILAAVGTNAYIVREIDLQPSQIDTAFTVNALLFTGLAILIYLLSFPASTFLAEPGVGHALRVLALRPLLLIFEFRPAAMLQRAMKFRLISIISTASSATNAGLMVLLAWAGYSYMSMAYAALAAGIVSALSYNIFAFSYASARCSLAHWRAVTTFGLRMLTISGLALIAHRLSEVIMGRLLGLASLGIFTRATQISDLLFFNFYATVTKVAFVRLSEANREGTGIGPTYLRALEMITALMWPILIGIAILAKPAIFILYGEQWLRAAAPLSVLMVAQFIAIGFSMNWELFVLKDETARQTRIEAVRATLSLSAFTVGCLFSLTAAAAGRVVDCLVGFALYHRHIKRIAEVSGAEIGRIFGASLVLTIGAVAPSAALMIWTGWSPRTPVVAIAAAVLAGMAIWLVLVAIMRHPLAGELRRLPAVLAASARA